MNEETKQNIKYGGIAIALVLLMVWCLCWWRSSSVSDLDVNISPSEHRLKNHSVGSNSRATTREKRTGKASDDGYLISEDVIIESLLKWYEQREERAIKVIETIPIRDVRGKASSMIVLATRDMDSEANLSDVTAALEEAAGKKEGLREDMVAARRRKQVSLFNDLARQHQEIGKQLIEEFGLTCFRVSRSKERPPVLAYWEGLPFEIGRRKEAELSAAKVLNQQNISFIGLLDYTVQSSLLEFKAVDGQVVFIDPVTLKSIAFSPDLLVNSIRKPDKDQDARIAKQWEEFLIR